MKDLVSRNKITINYILKIWHHAGPMLPVSRAHAVKCTHSVQDITRAPPVPSHASKKMDAGRI